MGLGCTGRFTGRFTGTFGCVQGCRRGAAASDSCPGAAAQSGSRPPSAHTRVSPRLSSCFLSADSFCFYRKGKWPGSLCALQHTHAHVDTPYPSPTPRTLAPSPHTYACAGQAGPPQRHRAVWQGHAGERAPERARVDARVAPGGRAADDRPGAAARPGGPPAQGASRVQVSGPGGKYYSRKAFVDFACPHGALACAAPLATPTRPLDAKPHVNHVHTLVAHSHPFNKHTHTHATSHSWCATRSRLRSRTTAGRAAARL